MPSAAVVAAARAAGLSHLYVEIAESSRGFYGAPGLAALLPAAHRAGLRVIAWVYPYLHDLPADVALTVAAARYRAPSGDRPDGVLADIEENVAEGTVHAYGQIVRAALGPAAPMAIAAVPPQSSAGRAFPFATAALSWDAIVPMDYWHAQRRAYGPAEVYAYVRDSVTQIRARAARHARRSAWPDVRLRLERRRQPGRRRDPRRGRGEDLVREQHGLGPPRHRPWRALAGLVWAG